ncbi:hypothetical protein B0J12DRAFT_738121 [Macrophomina phaseolina]|uniref:RRM domain-containing protein n=1 Tax=Macrophomina phaseolina TaxID=35725 RepID=A0ABQ8GM67_9PEZI|nr:hypothetical protein B0J12DRAFT_738121 [Macrophomina phaseolina]
MASMAPITPPPSAKKSHRRAHSTPDCVSADSSCDDALPSPSLEPSTPISPVESRHGGISINPDTPITPPSAGLTRPEKTCHDGRSKSVGLPEPVAESKPIFEFDISTEDPGKPVERVSPPHGNDIAAINTRIAIDRIEGTTRRAPLLTSRSDPAGLNSMTIREVSQPTDATFVQGHYGQDVFSSSSHRPVALCPPTSANRLAPSLSASSDEITPDNAQSRLSPNACLFVASLRKDKSDSELHQALTAQFFAYGKCYIKVKRTRGLPIAFVQYHESATADVAMELSTGVRIHERPCRIEKARAPRCIFISRRNGQPPSRDEVLSLMEKVGKLEKIWYPTDTERERYGLSPGFCCRFMYYQDAIDAIHAERNNTIYHVEPFRVADKLDGLFLFCKDSYLLEPNESSTAPEFHPTLHLPNALWVGNLPPNVTKLQLHRVFDDRFAPVIQMKVKIRRNRMSGEYNSYASIYFADHAAAMRAALCTHKKLRLATGEVVQIQWRLKPVLKIRDPKLHSLNHFSGSFGRFSASNTYGLAAFGNGLITGGAIGVPSNSPGFHSTAFGSNNFDGASNHVMGRAIPVTMYRPQYSPRFRQTSSMGQTSFGGMEINSPYMSNMPTRSFVNGSNYSFNGAYLGSHCPVPATSAFRSNPASVSAGYSVANGTYFSGKL